jgi:hypothetical protein
MNIPVFLPKVPEKNGDIIPNNYGWTFSETSFFHQTSPDISRYIQTHIESPVIFMDFHLPPSCTTLTRCASASAFCAGLQGATPCSSRPSKCTRRPQLGASCARICRNQRGGFCCQYNRWISDPYLIGSMVLVYMLTLGVYWWDPCYHI